MQSPPSARTLPSIGFREFVALIAAIMALNALALDQMLPALPAIGESLHVASHNDRQWIITAYFLGLGVGSLFYGSLSDRYGRKPVLVTALTLFLLSTFWCMITQSFPAMLAARGLSGLFSAAGRVLTVSIVRDRFEGDRMARVTSMIFFSFILVPIIAPSLGQLTLEIADWRSIFGSILLAGLPLLAWIALRLPETLAPANRVDVDIRDIAGMLHAVAGNRNAMGYMLATGCVSGALTGFMVSVQQIFTETFGRPALFPLAFAGMAGFMGIGSYFNSRLVERIGARRLSHASALIMVGLAGTHSLIILTGGETLATFMMLQLLTTLGFAFAVPNFSAISMAPFSRGAGLASSYQTFLTTVLSSLLGAAVGSAFDGTALPIALGFLVLGIAGLAIVAWAEEWRLFAQPDSLSGADDPITVNPSSVRITD